MGEPQIQTWCGDDPVDPIFNTLFLGGYDTPGDMVCKRWDTSSTVQSHLNSLEQLTITTDLKSLHRRALMGCDGKYSEVQLHAAQIGSQAILGLFQKLA